MIVVSDTSAITALLQIQRADILERLYDKVVIPREVEIELRRFHESIPDFIHAVSVTDRKRFNEFCTELDAGEAAAITLMLEGKGDVLLMDEWRGRRIAGRAGIHVIGLLGVLLEARLKGLIPSLAETIARLERLVNFRVSPALKNRAIVKAGEQPD